MGPLPRNPGGGKSARQVLRVKMWGGKHKRGRGWSHLMEKHPEGFLEVVTSNREF